MFGLSKKRKAIDKLFSEYVRPELVEAMKSPDFQLPLNEFSSMEISYLLVAVEGTTPNDIGKNLGVIYDMAKECGWFVDYLFSNLVVFIDGGPLSKLSSPLPRQELLRKIKEALGRQCKSVSGNQVAPWGSYGSSRRSVYGPMLPEFLDMVSQLSQQPFGTHTESIAP
jgi:hypothetical protein